MSNQIFHFSQPFVLESGGQLPELQIAFHTYGNYVQGVTPVVWICHALTANSDAADWWSGLVGEDKLFDPTVHFIVCANVIGSCYGSTGPLSVNPETGKPFYHSFPFISVRDIVKAHILLRKHLEITQIDVLIGGSLGGQQVLEWCIEEPEKIKIAVPIATNAVHSSWGRAFSESQRMALYSDPTFQLKDPKAGLEGLKTARSIALLSYRNYNTYATTQVDLPNRLSDFKAWSYQRYQGEKFIKRFNAFSYKCLIDCMDSHDLARNRGNLSTVLASITTQLIVIGINSDILFPISEQQFIAHNVKNAMFECIDSMYGHDGFLIETDQITAILKKKIHFLSNSSNTLLKTNLL